MSISAEDVEFFHDHGYLLVEDVLDADTLNEVNARILRGEPTLQPRQVALPIRLPFPKVPDADSIFDDQAEVRGRSFAVGSASAR